jgi:hypothetical protein
MFTSSIGDAATYDFTMPACVNDLVATTLADRTFTQSSTDPIAISFTAADIFTDPEDSNGGFIDDCIVTTVLSGLTYTSNGDGAGLDILGDCPLANTVGTYPITIQCKDSENQLTSTNTFNIVI